MFDTLSPSESAALQATLDRVTMALWQRSIGRSFREVDLTAALASKLPRDGEHSTWVDPIIEHLDSTLMGLTRDTRRVREIDPRLLQEWPYVVPCIAVAVYSVGSGIVLQSVGIKMTVLGNTTQTYMITADRDGLRPAQATARTTYTDRCEQLVWS